MIQKVIRKAELDGSDCIEVGKLPVAQLEVECGQVVLELRTCLRSLCQSNFSTEKER